MHDHIRTLYGIIALLTITSFVSWLFLLALVVDTNPALRGAVVEALRIRRLTVHTFAVPMPAVVEALRHRAEPTMAVPVRRTYQADATRNVA